MTPRETALAAFYRWDNALRPTVAGRSPPKGPYMVGLLLLERLKKLFNLRIEAHFEHDGAPVDESSGASLRAILTGFGESPPFVPEGYRATPASMGSGASLLTALDTARLERLTPHQRNDIFRELQAFLVDEMRQLYHREQLVLVYRPALTTRHLVGDLLSTANTLGKLEMVGRHLVGAHLLCRFPHAEFRTQSGWATDGRRSNPLVCVLGDTHFHVTTDPSLSIIEGSKRALGEGQRGYVLVPESCLLRARQSALLTSVAFTIESIETFVATSIEMLAAGSRAAIPNILFNLGETFNDMILKFEPEEWLRLEISGLVDEPVQVGLTGKG